MATRCEAILDETDFHAWTRAQAAALRRAAAGGSATPVPVDWAGIARQLDVIGAAERNEIKSRLVVLLEHLLKLRHLPMVEPRHGWRRTVREQRDAIERVIEESPSLRGLPAREPTRAYAKARRNFLAEYEVPGVAAECPFAVETEVLAEEWWPGEV